MYVAVVLRLLAEPLADGCIVGHAEIVDTGERRPVHDARELVALLCSLTETSHLSVEGGL